MNENRQGKDADEEASPGPPPRWLRQLTAAALSMRELAQAQWHLLTAEWRLARAAAMTALLAMLLIAVFALALGLTVMALAGWLLAQWLGSWTLALAVLGLILIACLAGSVYLFRRCLYWMSLPETRMQWRRLANDLRHAPATRKTAEGETRDDPTASTPD